MGKETVRALLCFSGCIIVIGACAKPAAEEAPAPVVDELAQTVELVTEESESEEVIMMEEVAPVEEEPDVIIRADSAIYLYMIRPNDYLVKIAQNEYGIRSEWRRIYSQNRDRIGDNPNLIFPYHEIQLEKLEDEIIKLEYVYSVHVVESGETLWSISRDKYVDPIAWIVIFLDNQEILGSDAEKLKPGMELKIRSALWAD